MVAVQQEEKSVNSFIDHLVILSSYVVAQVKCIIRSEASQQARLKDSTKGMTLGWGGVYVSYRGLKYLILQKEAYTL